MITNELEFFNNRKNILKYEINIIIENLNKVYTKYDTLSADMQTEISNIKDDSIYINGLIDKMIIINDNIEHIKSQIDDINYCIYKKEITNADELSIKIKEHDDMLKIWNTFLPSMLLYKISY